MSTTLNYNVTDSLISNEQVVGESVNLILQIDGKYLVRSTSFGVTPSPTPTRVYDQQVD